MKKLTDILGRRLLGAAWGTSMTHHELALAELEAVAAELEAENA